MGDKKSKKHNQNNVTQHPNSQLIRKPELRTNTQKEHWQSLMNENLPFVVGKGISGGGKTYLSVAAALTLLQQGKVSVIYLSTPAVEAGENLGYLPGDADEKLSPHLMRMQDAFVQLLGSSKKFEKLKEEEKIQIVPIAFLRGRTLLNAAIIIDETQNTTRAQIKMIVSRLGLYSRMFITGDSHQCDIKVPQNELHGLEYLTKCWLKQLGNHGSGYAVHTYQPKDTQRHEILEKLMDGEEQAIEEMAKVLAERAKRREARRQQEKSN